MINPVQCRRVLGVAALVGALQAGWTIAAAQTAPGQSLFEASCSACHTIGGGPLVGPDLAGLGARRSEAWIIAFVQHSQQVVASGDSTAVALFREFNEMPMPDQPLSADEVRQIVRYIDGAAPGAAAAPAAPAAPATAEEIALGRDLFQGTARFTNGGAPCTSCHDVTHEGITGGGALARELTTAVARLSRAGVQAIIANPPFPVMQRAYQGRSLTAPEVAALTAFLERAGVDQPVHEPRGFGPRLLAAGVAGTLVLLALYAFLWRRRSTASVYQRIFDRQLRSS